MRYTFITNLIGTQKQIETQYLDLAKERPTIEWMATTVVHAPVSSDGKVHPARVILCWTVGIPAT